MIYTNNAGRLGAGFISVCLETRWLGQKRGPYVPECYCRRDYLEIVDFRKERKKIRQKKTHASCPHILRIPRIIIPTISSMIFSKTLPSKNEY